MASKLTNSNSHTEITSWLEYTYKYKTNDLSMTAQREKHVQDIQQM